MSTLDRLESIVGVGDPEDPFVCRTCDETYEVEHHVCPTCGGFSVESRN